MKKSQDDKLYFLIRSLNSLEEIVNSDSYYDKEKFRQVLRNLLLIANELYKSKYISDIEFRSYYDRIYTLTNIVLK